ncbi:MAG: amidohydrolase family protein [Terracidiphilus sp.]|nr:amidohydrolase family protein [Terracidiphilus sp.]
MSAAAAALSRVAPGQAEPGPILDAHIHLFDPTRPGGVPWPPKDDSVLYQPSTPERYAALTARFGVVGAIAIEASPLASDNDWLLHVAEKYPVIVGVIGDLVPTSPSYRQDLDRLHRNPLFLGFRYGNLWDRDLAVDLHKPGFIEGVKELAAAGLVFESANPDPRLIRAILDVAERVPGLTIVIDHLPHAPVPEEAAARDAYWANLRQLARSPRVFVKLSEIPSVVNGALVTDPEFYRGALDAIWNVFGEDHILFGSDWPNSDHVAPYAQTLALVRGYVARKSPEAREKYFWKNSIAAYRWKRRRADQLAL